MKCHHYCKFITGLKSLFLWVEMKVNEATQCNLLLWGGQLTL